MKSPSEYDSFLANKRKFEFRRCEIAHKMRNNKETADKLKEEKEAINNSFKRGISDRFDYALRCAAYIDNDRIYCGDIEILNTMTLNECLDNIDHLVDYWNGICDVIREANETYNINLREKDTTKNEYAIDRRTSVCGKNAY